MAIRKNITGGEELDTSVWQLIILAPHWLIALLMSRKSPILS